MSTPSSGPIVVLSEQYRPKVGGAVRYVEGLVGGLLRSGCSVKLVVPEAEEAARGRSSPGPAARSGTEGLDVIRVPARGDVHGEWARPERRQFVEDVGSLLSNRVGEWRPRAIHVAYGHYLHRAVRGVSGPPTFWTVHNVPPAESRRHFSSSGERVRLGRRLREVVHTVGSTVVHRAAMALSPYTCLVAVSEHVAGKIGRLPHRGTVEVVGEGFTEGCCTLSELGRATEREAEARNGRLSLLTVAGLVSHKGQLLGLQAARELTRRGVAFTWRFVGPTRDRAYAREIEDRIAGYGLSDRVELTGTVAEERLCRLYRDADVYVQTSLEEGYCLSVLEALGHGTPVVGTRTGAIERLVSEGEGRVVRQNQPGMIAQAITELAGRDWSVSRRSALAEKVRARFSWKEVAERMLQLYERYQ